MATFVYQSRIDPWVLTAILLTGLASLGGTLLVLATEPLANWWTAPLILAGGTVMPFWLMVSTRYTLDGRDLVVRSGPLGWRIPVATISAISPSRSPLAGPALSLDRLRIEFGQGRAILISPRDKAHFLAEIEALRRQLIASVAC